MLICSWDEMERYFDKLHCLDKSCFPTSIWADSVWKGLFNHQQLSTILVFQKSALVGFIAFSTIVREAEILKMGVKTEKTCQGIGAGLLDKMTQQLRKNRIRHVFLEVREDNLPAVSLYQNHGFEQAGTRNDYYQSPLANALIFRCSFDDKWDSIPK